MIDKLLYNKEFLEEIAVKREISVKRHVGFTDGGNAKRTANIIQGLINSKNTNA